MAIRIVTVTPGYHGHGQKPKCCPNKLRDGQVIIETRVTHVPGADPFIYLHTDCVDTKIAQAPTGAPVGGARSGFERIRREAIAAGARPLASHQNS